MDDAEADERMADAVRRRLDPGLRGAALALALPPAVTAEVDPVLAARLDSLDRQSSAVVEEVTGEAPGAYPGPLPRWVRRTVMGVSIVTGLGGAFVLSRPDVGVVAAWAGLALLVVGLLAGAVLSTPAVVRRRTRGFRHNADGFVLPLVTSLYSLVGWFTLPRAVVAGTVAVAVVAAVAGLLESRRRRAQRLLLDPARLQEDERRLVAAEERVETQQAHLLRQVPPGRARQAVTVLTLLTDEAQAAGRLTQAQAEALRTSLHRRWPSARRAG